MVGGALDLIRGQSQELGSHIWEFHRQLGAMVARPAGATTGHDPAHEPSYGGLDPGEHVVGAARRDVRRPVRGAAAAFARISPQLGRADRRQARRRKKRRRNGRTPSAGYGFIHSVRRRQPQPEDTGGEKRSDALGKSPHIPAESH